MEGLSLSDVMFNPYWVPSLSYHFPVPLRHKLCEEEKRVIKTVNRVNFVSKNLPCMAVGVYLFQKLVHHLDRFDKNFYKKRLRIINSNTSLIVGALLGNLACEWLLCVNPYQVAARHVPDGFSTKWYKEMYTLSQKEQVNYVRAMHEVKVFDLPSIVATAVLEKERNKESQQSVLPDNQQKHIITDDHRNSDDDNEEDDDKNKMNSTDLRSQQNSPLFENIDKSERDSSNVPQTDNKSENTT